MLWIVGGVALAGVVAVAALVVSELREYATPPPEFASLVDQPDRSLRGTVAYYDLDAGCVRVVAAAGTPSKDVLCFAGVEDETGPQLAWRADGRLEVTVFRWPAEQPLGAGWQKLVDVRTGKVDEVPAAQVPTTPTKTPVPAVGPGGARVTATAKAGRITVELTDANGTRALLAAKGSPEYQVAGDPVWSPAGGWIVLHDGRLLLITVADPPVTRILAARPGGVGNYASFGSDGLGAFAVTDADVLARE
jgi:hypothetical protein